MVMAPGVKSPVMVKTGSVRAPVACVVIVIVGAKQGPPITILNTYFVSVNS